MAGLSAHLRSLSDADLLGLLERRPDAVQRGVAGFDRLAEALVQPTSCLVALRCLDAGAVQVLGLLVEVGLSATPARLTELLLRTGPVPDGHVEQALQRCLALALAWPDGAAWTAARGLARLGPGLLDTGPHLRGVLEDETLTELRPVLPSLGLPPARSRRDALEAVCGLVEDPGRLQALLDNAPPEVAQLLEHLATTGHGKAVQDDALTWLLQRRLVLVDGAGGQALPLEVARAVRGDRLVGVVHSEPALPPAAVPDPAVAATRALELVDAVVAVLRRLDDDPPKPLASGGLGVQVQRKLAKALGLGPPELCWLLDLAGSAGLLAVGPDAGRLTAAADAWLSSDPERAYADLVAPALHARPGPRAEDEDVAPLSWARTDDRALVPLADVAADLVRIGRPADIGPLLERLVWQHWSTFPRLLHRQLLGEQTTQLALLALQHDGGATPWLGPLLDGDADAAVVRLTAALPPAQDDAVWQADGTAVVVGRPSGDLRALLDGCAVRESDRTWRLTTTSVRSALDAGRTAPQLLAALQQRSRHAFPQVLEQLVHDVGAKHGRIHVAASQTTLQVTDPVLVVELLRDRRLAALALSELVPGLLGSAKKPAEVLAALRKAGHAPTGSPEAAPRRRRVKAQPAPSYRYGPTPQEAVRELRTRPDSPAPAAPAPGPTGRAQQLLARVRHLTTDDQVLLAEALLTGAPVEVDYVDAGGARTTRVISDLEDTGHLLSAWCELRDDERMFDPARISAVRTAD